MAFAQDHRSKLLHIVKTIFDPPDEIDADTLSEMEDEFCDSIDHPGGSALLHYPECWGLGESPTADQIVDEALNWKPRIITMTVESMRPHFRRAGTYVYDVAGAGIRTQVVSQLKLSVGQACQVALSGARLFDGGIASHGFIDDVFSAGEIVAAL